MPKINEPFFVFVFCNDWGGNAFAAFDRVCSDGIECPTGVTDVRYFPVPSDCRMYYECDNGKLYAFACPDGFYWNPELNYCDWEWNVTFDFCDLQNEEIPSQFYGGYACDGGDDPGGGGTGSCAGAYCIESDPVVNTVPLSNGERRVSTYTKRCSKTGCCDASCSGTFTSYICTCDAGYIVQNQTQENCSCAACAGGTYSNGSSCVECPLMGENGESFELGAWAMSVPDGAATSIYDCVANPINENGDTEYNNETGTFKIVGDCHWSD